MLKLGVSQYSLGCRYENGESLPQNVTKAIACYEKSARYGYASAQYKLGFFHENGLGLNRDLAEAQKWYEKAASQGNKEAEAALSRLKSNSQP